MIGFQIYRKAGTVNTIFSFTDSYFEISINNNEESADCDYLSCHSTITSGLTDVNKDTHDVFENLAKARRCNPKSLMCGYLNINSTRNKHEYIRDLLQRNLVDILFLTPSFQLITLRCSVPTGINLEEE